MVDFHTHILPNIDDGAADSSVAAAILQTESEQGVDTVVFTPHFYCKTRTIDCFLRQRAQAFSQILRFVPKEICVRFGCELHFSGVNMPDAESLCRLAVEGTKCILFEFPFDRAWKQGLLNQVSDFITDTGYTPIVAHAERYAEIRKTPEIASELASMGCLLQLNAEAFLEKNDRQFAFAMARHGLVHCLGTDAHDNERRAPRYAEARNAVFAEGLGDVWENAQDCMRKLLKNEEPELLPFTTVRKTLFGYK